MSAQWGDRVRVQFSRLPRNECVAAKASRLHVLEFTIGSKHALPGLSRHVVGMSQGEHKIITLDAEEAYGPVQMRLIREVPRTCFRTKSPLKLGMQLTARGPNSPQGRKVRIVELNRHTILIDGNHPSAGRSVSLSFLLVSVDSSSEANQSKPQFDNGGEG